MNEGLRTSRVYSTVQDENNIIWIASIHGIYTYDGYKFQMQTDDSVNLRKTYKRILCRDGVIWALPIYLSDSIVYYKDQKWHSLESIGADEIAEYFEVIGSGDLNQIMVTTDKGDIYHYDGKWQNYKSKDLGIDRLNHLGINNNKFIFALNTGLLTFENGAFKPAIVDDNLFSDREIYNFFFNNTPDGNYKLWLLDKFGLWLFEKNRAPLKIEGSEKLISFINGKKTFLLVDQINNVFFGDPTSLFLYNPRKNKINQIDYEKVFGFQGPQDMALDFENNLWISSLRGLLKVRLKAFISVNANTKLPNLEIASILSDKSKTYLGQNGSISIIDGKQVSNIYLTHPDGTDNNAARVIDIEKNTDGKIYFAALDYGFGQIVNDKIQLLEGYDGIDFYCIQFLNKRTFLGTSNGLYEYSNENLKKILMDNTFIRRIKNLGDSLLVLCTGSDGIKFFRNDSVFRVLNAKEDLANHTFDYLPTALYGNLIGTDIGLFIESGNSLKRAELSGQKIEYPVYFIFQDKLDQKIIWMGTDHGLIKYNGESLFYYNTSNGFPGNECNRFAISYDQDDVLWVGTDRGAVKYYSDFDYEPVQSGINCFVSSVEYGQQKIANAFENLNIPGDAVIIFNFRYPSFVDEQNSKFEIKLYNKDKNLLVSDTTASTSYHFISLSPGSYLFELKAFSASYIPSSNKVSIGFNIIPPFYFRTWFIISSLFILLFLTYITLKYKEQKRYAQLLEKEINLRIGEVVNSERNLSITLDSIGDAVIVTDSDGIIQRVNNSAEILTGVTKGLLTGQVFEKIFKFHDPDNNTEVGPRISRELIDSKQIIYYNYLEMFKYTGDSIIVSLSAAPIVQENKNIGNVMVIKDLSEKFYSQKALEESERRFHLLAETSFEGISIVKHGKIIHVNKEFADLLGYPAEEMIGMSPMDFVAPESKVMVLKKMNDNEMNPYEYTAQKKDGSQLPVEVRGRKITFQNEVLRATAIRDISDRKKHEEELIKAKEIAVRSEELKTEFLAQMSHEIRTPLNTILSFAYLLRDELQNIVSDDLKACFLSIDSAGRRIIRTIDLILNMSEIQTGTYEIVKKELNVVEDIIVPIELEYIQTAKNSGLYFKITNNSEKQLLIHADEYTVFQIFSNLIDNAIKFTNNGGIEISISEIEGNIKIDIRDTGIGISEEYLPNLFTPFTQEDQGYTRKYEGNGLGLTLVRNYCELNNIRISVDSNKNKGTTFTLIFQHG